MKTLFIEPASTWEHGYCESFNSKLRDELLNAELFNTLCEAEVLLVRAVRRQHVFRETKGPCHALAGLPAEYRREPDYRRD